MKPTDRIVLAAMALTALATVVPPDASAAEPDYSRTPVLMVHGYFPVEAADWVTWGRFKNKLVEDGWPEEYVMAPQFNDTMGCDPDHAREISAWVDELRSRTGFDKINIVAHSEGGLNTMYYLRYFCGVHKVANFVGLAIAVHGTRVACVDFWSCGADEMCIASGADGWKQNPVLAGVNECDETLGDVLYTSIWTDYDEIIIPQEGSKLYGARNIELETPLVEHGAIFLVDESFNYMKDALLNRAGLNTDGPGWDCIQHCVVPEQADQVEMPHVVEGLAEDPQIDETPPETAEEALSDAVEPPDAGPHDGATVVDGTVIVPYDPGPMPADTSSNRDSAVSDRGAPGDLATDSAAAADSNGSDDSAGKGKGGSGGCSASDSPVTSALPLIFLVALVLVRRRESASR